MKSLFLSTLILVGVSTTAFAADATQDCIGSIRDALSLASGQELNLTGGTNEQGLACEFSIKYKEAQSGLTNQNYRGLDIVPSSAQRYADGGISPVAPTVLASLEDNSNGMDSYEVNVCNVSKDGIDLKYSQHQTYGWHRTDKFNFKIYLDNGKISRVDTNNFGCFFK